MLRLSKKEFNAGQPWGHTSKVSSSSLPITILFIFVVISFCTYYLRFILNSFFAFGRVQIDVAFALPP
jgi:hypothetical protein